jgi:hypothetical protein
MTSQRRVVYGIGVTPAYVDVALCADVIRCFPLDAIEAHARNKQVASATVLRQDAITAHAKKKTACFILRMKRIEVVELHRRIILFHYYTVEQELKRENCCSYTLSVR